MSERAQVPVYANDVFAPTDKGKSQIQRGSVTRLPRDTIAVLVMLDGKRAVGDLEFIVRALDPKAIREIIRSLLSAGLVREVTLAERGDIDLDFTNFFRSGVKEHVSAGAEKSAQEETKAAAPQLKAEGYYVALARQSVRQQAKGRFSVFVVEDDPDMAALIRVALPAHQFEMLFAATKKDVLHRLNQMPLPHLTILDVHLPDLNGFDLLQKMKAHPVLKTVPVVMLTADSKPESIVQGLISGADGYITKPFDRAALLAGVQAVLGISA